MKVDRTRSDAVRSTRLRSIAMTCILTLLLGATTSVAVAWVFAMDVLPIDYEWTNNDWTTNGLRVLNCKHAGYHTIRIDRQPRTRGSYQAKSQPAEPFPNWSTGLIGMQQMDAGFFEEASGWPFLCLKASYSESTSFNPYVAGAVANPRARVNSGIRVGNPHSSVTKPRAIAVTMEDSAVAEVGRGTVVLPTTPILKGLVLGSVFWSVPWWGLVIGLAMVRRLLQRRRIHHVKCQQCRYALRGLAEFNEQLKPKAISNLQSLICPECGWRQADRLPFLPRRLNAGAAFMFAAMVATLVGAILFGISSRVGPETIHIAALEGDIASIQNELAKGVSIDHPVSTGPESLHGTTPLMWAVMGGRESTVEFLIDHNADLSASDNNGNQPMHYAAMLTSPSVIEILIGHGCDLEAVGSFSTTPLVIASLSDTGRVIAKYLITSGARVDSCARFGFTPIKAALQYRDIELTQLLLARGAFPIQDPLCSYSDESFFTDVIKAGPDFLQLFVDAGHDLNGYAHLELLSLTILHLEDSVSVLEFLLEAGLSPNGGPSSSSSLNIPLFTAVHQGDLAAFQLLLESGANLAATDHNGDTVLFEEEILGWNDAWWVEPAYEWFLDPKWRTYISTLDLPLNVQNVEGFTALMSHARNGNVAVVEFFLEQGADPMVQVDEGVAWSPRAIDINRTSDLRVPLEDRARIHQLLSDAMAEYGYSVDDGFNNENEDEDRNSKPHSESESDSSGG